jgi:hypothetical protein
LPYPSLGLSSSADTGSLPSRASGAIDTLQRTMSALELRTHLIELKAERALAEETGVASIPSYLEDLERDIARSRAAFVGAAVTEIASFRAQLSGRTFG